MKQGLISCSRHCEESLKFELEQLGLKGLSLENGGVAFEDPLNQWEKILLGSRLGSKIFFEWNSFTFTSEKDLYSRVKKLPFEELMGAEETFSIKVILDHQIKNKFKSSLYLAQLTKDALVDRMRAKLRKRPDVNTQTPDYPFLLRIEPHEGKLKALFMLDICGLNLGQRGYRPRGHPAPMRETLAATLVQSCQDKSNHIFDPFCGSGTLLVEWAYKQNQISPRYIQLMAMTKEAQVYAFQRQRWFRSRPSEKDKFFQKIESDFVDSKTKLGQIDQTYFANDIRGKNLELCRDSWKSAGLPLDALETSKNNALTLLPPESKGIVITNPPYGNRLEELDKAKELLHEFGENLKNNFKGWNAYIMTGDPQMKKNIGLRSEFSKIFFNGPHEGRFLKYSLY